MKEKPNRRDLYNKVKYLCITVIFLALPISPFLSGQALAATDSAYFSPSSGCYVLGDDFSVSIGINTSLQDNYTTIDYTMSS